ncbi:hypothetical protein HYW53_03230 [Candidatus Giovannonibacteria bacterium]|nr:hypothetical protein [Candidatus Giovannonibacteria bacterium]
MNLFLKTGLELEYINGDIELPEDICVRDKWDRTVEAMSPVLFLSNPGDKRAMYRVWRGIYKKEDAEFFDNLKISYDFTAVFPVKINKEIAKTFGHYHSRDMMGVMYPEILEVISGKVWWILQKPRLDPSELDEIYFVQMEAGEKVIIPAGYGHNISNPAGEDLILANLLCTEDKHDYKTYESLRGAGYYLIESENQQVEFKKNTSYKFVPEIIKLKPKNPPGLGLDFKESLYQMAKNQNLEFLSRPHKYAALLTIENCFEKI